ncbi:hypothetical protein HZC09_00230 [Candidatus Micrarchaeota archaeon]|nr:hypothetical protein [Candidatus Micrarchaeota archaeon]
MLPPERGGFFKRLRNWRQIRKLKQSEEKPPSEEKENRKSILRALETLASAAEKTDPLMSARYWVDLAGIYSYPQSKRCALKNAVRALEKVTDKIRANRTELERELLRDALTAAKGSRWSLLYRAGNKKLIGFFNNRRRQLEPHG